MLSPIYRLLNSLARRWLAVLIALAGSALILGCWGFSKLGHDISTTLYRSLQIFAIDAANDGAPVPLQVDIARWLGAVVSFSTILGVLVRVFHQPAMTFLVTCFARRHVVVCGLGEQGERLVEQLTKAGKSVVVIDPRHDHPGLDECRSCGAVVLFGSPSDSSQLERARLRRADMLLSLFQDDRNNVATAVRAKQGSLLRTQGKLTCVLQVVEPGLTGILRQHAISTKNNERFHLEILNRFEVTARTMLREAALGGFAPDPKRILVVGIGKNCRLGESLIVRAAKDWAIEHADESSRIEIHVFDAGASRWVENVKQRYSFLESAWTVVGHDSLPGIFTGEPDEDATPSELPEVDAVFVCLADETQSVLCAKHLRDHCSHSNPIVVRVTERTSGLGAGLSGRDAGGLGSNIMTVGIQERAYELATATQPESELLAQSLHEDYLRKVQFDIRSAKEAGNELKAVKLMRKDAYCPWNELAETFRVANRELANRLTKHLLSHSTSYVPRYAPDERIRLLELSEKGIEALARGEHDAWVEERRRNLSAESTSGDGVAKGNPHPDLVNWEDLDEGSREYDRNIIRRLPYVLAKADYALEKRE